MIRIPYLHCPVPLTLAVMVAFLVTLAVLKPLTAQSGQSSTADTTVGSETQSPDSEPQRAQPAPALDKSSIDSATDVEVQPAPAPDKSGIDAATDVEIQRRFNELQRELLDDRREFLDKRAKDVDWWLTAIVVFLTLIAVLLTFFAIVAAIVGYFGFQRFREIEARAEKHAEEAERVVEHIKARRDEADSLLKDMNAETTHNDPDKASEVVETVQQNPAASPTDRAVADAISLQQQGKGEEAIEKWRSIANVAGAADTQLQARAWFSVGYLLGEKDDWKAAMDCYTKAIRLDPNRAEAYNNRGVAKAGLGRLNEAREDYQKALALAQESGNKALIAEVQRNLIHLDNDKAS